MSFLLPWAFGFLALLPAIIALYLLKIRRRPATVSTLLFWQRVLEENRRRALFQRLRNFLSLLLILLIFLLILFALAKPILDRHFRNGVSTVLVLDRRARMQAVTGGTSDFERARDLALGYARHSSELRPTALVLAGGPPEIAAPFTTDPSALAQVVAQVRPTGAAGSLEPALGLARQIAASRGADARVVVLTSDQSVRAADGLEVIPVGSTAGNVGIVVFAARPLPASPETYSVLLRVQNFNRGRKAGRVEIALDGRIIDLRPFDLAAGEVFSATFPLVPELGKSERGWLTATLAEPDALALDNTAYAALPALEPARILLVSSGNWFLENLLRADETIRFDLLDPSDFQPSMAGAFDAVILDDVVPENFDAAIAPGNWLLLGRAASAAPPVKMPLVAETAADSPLLRLVDLGAVTFLRAAPPDLPTGEGWRIERPVMGLEAPLIATAENGKRRLAYFGFGVSDSDLPLRVAFPLLMSNTLQWLTGSRTPEPVNFLAGQNVPLREEESIAAHPGEEQTPALRDTFTPLQNGFYEMKRGERTLWAAVNTFAPEESDLRRHPLPTSPEGFEPPTPRLGQWPLWYLFALGALVLLIVEWGLYHRRYTE